MSRSETLTAPWLWLSESRLLSRWLMYSASDPKARGSRLVITDWEKLSENPKTAQRYSNLKYKYYLKFTDR